MRPEQRTRVVEPAILVLAVVITAAIVLAVAMAGSSAGRPTLWLCYTLLCALLLAAVLPMIWEASRDKLDIFNLKNAFVLYYVLQLGVYPAYVFASGEPHFAGLEPDNAANLPLYAEVLTMSLLGLIAFHLGYGSRWGSVISRRFPRPADWNQAHVIPVALSTTVIGLGTALLFFYLYGGVREFLVNRESWRAEGVSGSGVLIFPIIYLLPAGVVMCLLSSPKGVKTRGVPYGLVALFCLSLVPASLLGFRSAIAPTILQLLAAWHYHRRRLTLRTAVALTVVLVALFTWYGLNRQSRTFFDASIRPAEIAKPVLLRSPGTEVVAVVVGKLRETRAYQYGWRGVVEAATILVPRKLWTGKITPASVEFANEFFASYIYQIEHRYRESYGGVSPTIVGTLFWNFGWPGVIIGMFTAGIVAQAAYAYLQNNVGNRSCLFLYSLALGAFVQAAEAPQDAVNGLVLKLVATSVLLFLLRSHEGTHRRECGVQTCQLVVAQASNVSR